MKLRVGAKPLKTSVFNNLVELGLKNLFLFKFRGVVAFLAPLDPPLKPQCTQNRLRMPQVTKGDSVYGPSPAAACS